MCKWMNKCVNLYAVYLKLTQHCKSIILQLKKKNPFAAVFIWAGGTDGREL